MKATFENSVNVLVKAFFDGTLEHSNCYACAVGNLVASATNKKMVRKMWGREVVWEGCEYPAFGNIVGGWGRVVTTCQVDEKITIDLLNYRGEAKVQIDATGYSPEELGRIEFAFERTEDYTTDEDHRFKGLMQVVEVLADIHGIDLKVKEEAKLLFVKS